MTAIRHCQAASAPSAGLPRPRSAQRASAEGREAAWRRTPRATTPLTAGTSEGARVIDAAPLYGLRLRTPRLELRLGVADGHRGRSAALAERGIHPPEEMPFAVAWCDGIGEPGFVEAFVAFHAGRARRLEPGRLACSNLLVWAAGGWRARSRFGGDAARARARGHDRLVARRRRSSAAASDTEMRARRARARVPRTRRGGGRVGAGSRGTLGSARVSEKLGYRERAGRRSRPRGDAGRQPRRAARAGGWLCPFAVEIDRLGRVPTARRCPPRRPGQPERAERRGERLAQLEHRGEEVAVPGNPVEHLAHREGRRIESGPHLLPAQRRRDGRPGARPHRVDRTPSSCPPRSGSRRRGRRAASSSPTPSSRAPDARGRAPPRRSRRTTACPRRCAAARSARARGCRASRSSSGSSAARARSSASLTSSATSTTSSKPTPSDGSRSKITQSGRSGRSTRDVQAFMSMQPMFTTQSSASSSSTSA